MSRRVTSRLVRTGARAITLSAAGEYNVVPFRGEPNIWAHVVRDGLRASWYLTVDRSGAGERLADGRRWQRENAFIKAAAVAQRPSVVEAARRATERRRAAR